MINLELLTEITTEEQYEQCRDAMSTLFEKSFNDFTPEEDEQLAHLSGIMQVWETKMYPEWP